MRVNVSKAWTAYRNRKAARPSDSISTDSRTIYSYRTAILTDDPFVAKRGWELYESPGRPWTGNTLPIWLNPNHYSKTTTTQQNSLRVALHSEGYRLVGSKV